MGPGSGPGIDIFNKHFRSAGAGGAQATERNTDPRAEPEVTSLRNSLHCLIRRLLPFRCMSLDNITLYLFIITVTQPPPGSFTLLIKNVGTSKKLKKKKKKNVGTSVVSFLAWEEFNQKSLMSQVPSLTTVTWLFNPLTLF